MPPRIHVHTKVLTGGRIVVAAADYPVGQDVEVTITPVMPMPAQKKSILEIIKSSPPQRSFKSSREVDEYLRQERDSWDR